MEKEKLVQIVNRAQSGDSDALNELFNAFYNDVYYFALKIVKDEDLACDITQESFAEIINTLGNLKEPAAFVTWMKQITYHQCTRYFKKKKDVLVDENEDGDTIFDTVAEDRVEFIPDEAVDQADFRATIMAMIDQLSDEQRSATMMYYFDEMSVKEIAQAQGVGENTVKGRLSYSRKAIKKSVEDYEKKNNVKLHCIGLLPLLLWLFRNYGKGMPVAAVKTVAEKVSTGTGVGICVTAVSGAVPAAITTTAAVGLGTKIAAVPLTIKVTAATVATAVTISAVTIGLIRNTDNTPAPTTSLQTQTTAPIDDDPTAFPPNDEDSTTPSEEPITPPVDPTSPPDDPTTPSDGPTTPPDGPTTPPNGPTTPPNGPTTPPDDPTTPSDDPIVPDETPSGDSSFTYRVPDGCTYTAANGTVFTSGDVVTANCTTGDIFTDGEYHYIYNKRYDSDQSRYVNHSGWSVATIDSGKSSYSPITAEINGSPVVDLSYVYYNCTALQTAPVIPDGVTSLNAAFRNCSSLRTAPTIPESVTNLEYTFSGCRSLQTAPVLPNGLTRMTYTFAGCDSLQTVSAIPDSVTELMYTYYDCISLQTAPVIPDGVTKLSSTFQGCTSLETAPIIPKSVVDMHSTFADCSSLTKVPAISDGVTKLYATFQNCVSLQNAPTIPNSVIDMGWAFSGCELLQTAPVIPNGVTNLYHTFQNCRSLQTAPVIPNSVTNMNGTFHYCRALTKASDFPINVTDISSAYEETAITKAPTIPDSVLYASDAFAYTNITTAPTIPSNVICASRIFYNCNELTGEVVIHANLHTTHNRNQCGFDATSNVNTFDLFGHCAWPIVLTGTSSQLEEIASLYDNVSVK